ncbi:hypothetical protein [Streptosporangium sp. NPDC004631]
MTSIVALAGHRGHRHAVVDRDQTMRDLEEVRRNGYAVDMGNCSRTP